jgi:acetylornithine deacetylase/succinyl-diaminopimelate desuccinylase-like protein
LAALRADVEALAAMTRDSAGAGERAAAAWVAGRLREAGASDVRVEPFRYQATYAWAHAAHAAAGLLAARLRSRSLALAALASLELEVSGRAQWLRRVLPSGEGANVVARVPARGEARATLVLVAHHDAARTGLPWHPRIQEAGAARRLRRRSVDPFQAPTALGFLLVALGARRAGSALLAASIVADLDIARSPTVPGASDNATGVAAVLELARRFAAEPLDGVDVEIVSTGCEESGMGGMAAYLRKKGVRPLFFVLGLDTLGAGTPIVCRAEGTILTHRYRDEDLELADAGARRAGLEPPQRWRIGGWTDPILARFAGLPALSLLSMGPGYFPNYHRVTDVPAAVDWDSVDRCLALADGIAREFAGRLR